MACRDDTMHRVSFQLSGRLYLLELAKRQRPCRRWGFPPAAKGKEKKQRTKGQGRTPLLWSQKASSLGGAVCIASPESEDEPRCVPDREACDLPHKTFALGQRVRAETNNDRRPESHRKNKANHCIFCDRTKIRGTATEKWNRQGTPS